MRVWCLVLGVWSLATPGLRAQGLEYVKEHYTKTEHTNKCCNHWLDSESSLIISLHFISCIEEIAYKKGFINEEQLLKSAEKYGKSGYGSYLKDLVK